MEQSYFTIKNQIFKPTMKSKIETNEYQKINDDIKFILGCYEEMLTRIDEVETIHLLKLNQVSQKEGIPDY